MAALHRSRSTLYRRIALLSILAILLVVVVTGAVAVQHALSIKQRLDRVQALAGGSGSSGMGVAAFKSLHQELDGSRQDFLVLKAIFSPFVPVVERLGWLPKVGPTVQATPHLVAMGDDFLQAAAVLFDGLDPLVETALGSQANGGSDAPSITERVLPALLAAQPRFVEAQDLIEKAATEREQIPVVGLLPILAKQLDRMDKYLPSLRSASQLAAIAPNLLGAVRPMKYLLMPQNNDELRPTGGFMTAFGVLVLDKGKITDLTVFNSYSVDNWTRDHPAPPELLTRFMGAELWMFRDANFWPDFPTSAKAAEYFANLDLDFTPDGVIAADQFALQDLVGGLGGVVVPEYQNDTLTGDNTIAKIRTYWDPPPVTLEEDPKAFIAWYSEHKQFMSYLIQAMRNKLETDIRSINPAQFGKALLKTLNQKHILIYLNDPLGGGLAEGANWAGALKPASADYLMAVDMNMGFNKANAIVQRSIDYAVDIDPSGLARSRVTVSYQNPSTRQVECIQESYFEASYDLLINRCYFNYLRIYVPDGATAIAGDDGTTMENAGKETGKQVWGQWLVVAPQEKAQIDLSYYLPASVLHQSSEGREYRLLVQKQPGTDTTPLHVTVTLPQGTTVLGASPEPESIAGNVVQFAGDLATDQEFRVVIK